MGIRITLVAALAAAACSPSAPAAVPDIDYSEEPFPVEAAQRRVVRPSPIELPRLPRRGFVASSERRVAFFDARGELITVIDGFFVTGNDFAPGIWLQRRSRAYYRLDVRRHRLVPVPARRARSAMYDEDSEPQLPEPPDVRFRGMVVGRWRAAVPSPDGRYVLGQWSGECEVPSVYWIEDGALPILLTGAESLALGWTRDGRAIVHKRQGYCGGAGTPPGVYLYSAPEEEELLFATRRFHSIEMWGR